MCDRGNFRLFVSERWSIDGAIASHFCVMETAQQSSLWIRSTPDALKHLSAHPQSRALLQVLAVESECSAIRGTGPCQELPANTESVKLAPPEKRKDETSDCLRRRWLEQNDKVLWTSRIWPSSRVCGWARSGGHCASRSIAVERTAEPQKMTHRPDNTPTSVALKSL